MSQSRPTTIVCMSSFLKGEEFIRECKRLGCRVLLITECSMGDNLQAANPSVEFVRSCFMCPYMKRISLPKILHSLVFWEMRSHHGYYSCR